MIKPALLYYFFLKEHRFLQFFVSKELINSIVKLKETIYNRSVDIYLLSEDKYSLLALWKDNFTEGDNFTTVPILRLW